LGTISRLTVSFVVVVAAAILTSVAGLLFEFTIGMWICVHLVIKSEYNYPVRAVVVKQIWIQNEQKWKQHVAVT
jgi:hypothetical protein